MEEQIDKSGLLDLTMQPAFCVKDGIIVQLNRAARQFLIEPDTPIANLLGDDAQEYEQFQGGCLYLTLTISGQPFGASVRQMDGFDVFRLELDSDQPELRAMALVAQELRELLAGILAIADRLLPTMESSGDPDVQAQVHQMNRRLFQMLRTVGNMSDASRYADETASRQVCQNICSVLTEIFAHAEPLVREKGITLHYSGPRESILCMIDREKLERAVYNIISNAMKFTEEGGTITAKLTRRNNKLYLSIQDSGSGIPPELLGNVYNRFQRSPGLEDSRHGLGLGLVLIRSAATAHGGTVLIDQLEGVGTRITMSIAIRNDKNTGLRSDRLEVDYDSGRDRGLLELSDALPPELYSTKN